MVPPGVALIVVTKGVTLVNRGANRSDMIQYTDDSL